MSIRALMAAMWLPSALVAQGAAATPRLATCGEAFAAIGNFQSLATLRDGLSRAGSCDRAAERGRVSVSALQRLRMSIDTATLSTLTAFAADGENDAIDALVTLASDRLASEVARIAALAALLRRLMPQQYIRYQDLTGGIGEKELPRALCNGGVIAHQMPPSRYSAEVKARIAATGRRLHEDTTEAPNIRSAGRALANEGAESLGTEHLRAGDLHREDYEVVVGRRRRSSTNPSTIGIPRPRRIWWVFGAGAPNCSEER